MRYLFIIAMAGVLFTACNKDKFSSTPRLTYKSVNTTVLNPNEVITFEFNFTDKEGDVDSVYVEKVVPSCTNSQEKEMYPVPVLPVTRMMDGTLWLSFANGVSVPGYFTLQTPQCGHNDTCVFRFMLRDKAGHKSDTVNTGTIVIVK